MINNLFQNFLQTLLTNQPKRQLNLLYFFATFVFLFIAILARFHVSICEPDTMTYFDSGEIWAKGIIDKVRTPVYPIICHLSTYLGPFSLWTIVLLQFFVFCLSIKWLFNTLRLIFPDKHLTMFVSTALYAVNPAIVQNALSIMTESLSLSMTVLLLFIIVKGIKQKFAAKDVAGISVLYVVMLLIRPFFICFAPILVLFLFWINRTSTWRTIVASAIGVVLVGGVYLGYCYAYKQKYGVFTTTCVSVINFDAQLYEAGLIESPVYKLDNFDVVLANNRIVETRNAHFMTWVKHEIKETMLSGRQRFPLASLQYGGILIQLFVLQVPLSVVYLLTLIFGCWKFWQLIKYRSDVRIEAILFLIVVATVFTSVWGAFSNYSRLILPAYPCVCIIIAYFAQALKLRTDWSIGVNSR